MRGLDLGRSIGGSQNRHLGGVGRPGGNRDPSGKRGHTLGKGQTADCLFKTPLLLMERPRLSFLAQRKLLYNARQYECSFPAVAVR